MPGASREGSTHPCRDGRPIHAGRVPLQQKLQQLVDDLAVLDDPQERLAFVIDRAKNIPRLPPEKRVEANRVRACISVVWIASEMRDGLCYFRGDAESPVVRGLVVLLCEFFSGSPPAAIASSEIDPLETLGLNRHLTPTRRNGLSAARATLRARAESLT